MPETTSRTRRCEMIRNAFGVFAVFAISWGLGACGASPPREATAADWGAAASTLKTVADQHIESWARMEMKLVEDAIGLDENVVVVGTDEGEFVAGRQAYLDGLRSAFASYDSATGSYRDFRALLSRDGSVAWVFYVYDLTLTAGDKKHVFKGIRYTAVYEMRNGRWFLVQSHASAGLAPGPGNTRR
jgi:ketosteroid isomerase-like protein